MRVTYSPENGQVQTWDYYPAKVKASQAEMIEKRSGLSWDEFNKSLLSGAAKARKVLLWHLLTREHPVFRYEDTPDFCMAEVQVEFDAKELGDIRAAVEKAKDMDETTKAEALNVLDEQLAKAGAADPLGPVALNSSASGSGV